MACLLFPLARCHGACPQHLPIELYVPVDHSGQSCQRVRIPEPAGFGDDIDRSTTDRAARERHAGQDLGDHVQPLDGEPLEQRIGGLPAATEQGCRNLHLDGRANPLGKQMAGEIGTGRLSPGCQLGKRHATTG